MTQQYIIINELGDQVGPVMSRNEAYEYRAKLEKHFTDYFSIVVLRGSEKPPEQRLVMS